LIFDGGFSPSFFRSDVSIAAEGTPLTEVSFAGAHGASSVDDPSLAVDADLSVEQAASAAAARIAVANRDRIIGSLAFEFHGEASGGRRTPMKSENRASEIDALAGRDYSAAANCSDDGLGSDATMTSIGSYTLLCFSTTSSAPCQTAANACPTSLG
jgi:hypothetical protein